MPDLSLLTGLTVLAAFIAGVVLALSLATIGIGLHKRFRDRIETNTRRSVRGQFFERRRQPEPEWEVWIASLDEEQREQLIMLIDGFLRSVSGSQRDVYVTVANHLEMGERAVQTLANGSVLERKRALARLTVLEYPVSEEFILDTCIDDRGVREAAARLLYERRGEFDRPAALGTVLLLWDGQQPMTARGLQTLFELNDGRPIPLLSQGRWSGEKWETRLLTQVFEVLEKCQTTLDTDYFEWLLPLFDADEPRVRAGAIRAFKQVGWQESVRSDIPLRQLISDDDPRVRQSTYRVLAYWGDDRAEDTLEWAVIDEADPRSQLVAIRGLVSIGADPMEKHPAWPEASWAWVRAEIAVTERRRLPQQPRGPVA